MPSHQGRESDLWLECKIRQKGGWGHHVGNLRVLSCVRGQLWDDQSCVLKAVRVGGAEGAPRIEIG